MAKVKILDIARELKLSRNTVAKALNNDSSVTAETKRLVLEKAIRMGYEKLPKEAAEKYSGFNETSKQIVVLTRRDLTPFWNRIIMGINDEMAARRYTVNYCFVNEENAQDVNMLNIPANIKGVIVLSVYSDGFLERFSALNVPIVFLDYGLDNNRDLLRGDIIFSEGFSTVCKITKKLIEQGLMKVGFIGDITYCKTIKDRYEGYLQALQANDIAPDSDFMLISKRPNRYYTKEEVEKAIYGIESMPEAFVCANDEIALLLIQCLNERGLNVPKDIAVTGYDNIESLVGQRAPFLTTVKIEHGKMGKRLANQLLYKIDNYESPNEMIMIWGGVIMRESSEKFI